MDIIVLASSSRTAKPHITKRIGLEMFNGIVCRENNDIVSEPHLGRMTSTQEKEGQT
jgi:hypothetical protein